MFCSNSLNMWCDDYSSLTGCHTFKLYFYRTGFSFETLLPQAFFHVRTQQVIVWESEKLGNQVHLSASCFSQNASAGVSRMLLGNKCDIEAKRKVSKEMGEKVSK